MSDNRRIAFTFTPADKAAFQQKIKDATALIPALVNITKTQKQRIAVIGAGRAGMDEVFQRHMKDHPEFVPGYLNMTEVTNDLSLRQDAADLLAPLTELVQVLSDAISLASADNYSDYLAYYHSVQAAAARGIPGASTVLPDLEPFFPTGHKPATAAAKKAASRGTAPGTSSGVAANI